MEPVLIIGIILALFLNFVNGMNDAANAISTIIATKVLTPIRAVGLAAFFNLIGPLFFTTAVARTVGAGLIDLEIITPVLIIAALSSAIVWVFLTTRLGIPVSSTHAMIGGLLGGAIASAGAGAVLWPPVSTLLSVFVWGIVGAFLGALFFVAVAVHRGDPWQDFILIGALFGFAITIPILVIGGILVLSGILAIVVFMVISPTLGFLIAFLFGALTFRRLRNANPTQANLGFRRLQLLSSAFYSLGHGSNDAQHAMGIITALLVAGGLLSEFTVPLWVILSSSAAISLGTFLGGWTVVETMARKITALKPYQGFCAETGGGVVLSLVTMFGIPVSSTHAISGAIMGVGATRGYSAVKWGIVREIVATWIITIPASAALSWIFYWVIFGAWS